MLLFICALTPIFIPKGYFKTSHVIVYQWLRKYNRFICLISKHLMLLFIEETSVGKITTHTFQNISCYCLSWTELRWGSELTDFKTSHVIVYQRGFDNQAVMNKHFKTSHVIVYHEPEVLSPPARRYFKTSHVIVYRNSGNKEIGR